VDPFQGVRSTLTVTLGEGVTFPANSSVYFAVTGATNPAAQAARTDVVIRTTTSADAVLAETSSGTLPAIGGGATAS
jgi:hypothetical protein